MKIRKLKETKELLKWSVGVLLSFGMIVAMWHNMAYATEIWNENGENLNVEGSSEEYEILKNYLWGRAEVLEGENQNALESVSVVGIVNDELEHQSVYEQNNVEILNRSFSVVKKDETEEELIFTVVESVTHKINNILGIENIEHEIICYETEYEDYIVVADIYQEKFTGFSSCSYVDERDIEDTNELNAATAGSTICMTYIARSQVGYKEKASNANLDDFTANAGSANYTKYGKWIGANGLPWCASFVSWCANQATVSTTVIKSTADCDTMMSFFKNKSQYNLSSAYGGSYTPASGDIFFQGTSQSDSTHVGIVVSVSGSVITVVDGNCDDAVKQHTYSKTDSRLLGFAHPNYGASTHTWVASSNYYVCKACGITATTIPSELD